jgi:phage tail-like protein
MSLNAVLGLTTRFLVEIDGINLGGWGQCTGLSVEFVNEKVEEGGLYDYQHLLPTKIQYSDIQLERAMNAADSAKVQQWLSSKVGSYMHNANAGGGSTAQITLCDATGHKVASWSLRNVYPQKWDGPKLDAASFTIARETLKLSHEGFL